MVQCLLIQSSLQLHGTSLPKKQQDTVSDGDKSYGGEQSGQAGKGVRILKGCQKSTFQAEKVSRMRTLQGGCALHVEGAAWRLVSQERN